MYFRLSILVALTLSAALCVQADDASAFAPVFQILRDNCGNCHRQGGASSWTVDAPASTEHYPDCLQQDRQSAIQRCTTWHQLIDIPGPEIPPWVIIGKPGASAPYVQACDAQQSYHVGVSLPQLLSPGSCRLIVDWINSGARP